MSDASDENGSLQSLIARLADEFQERLDRGESPDPGEFANVASQHPDIVRQLSAEMLHIYRATHPDAHLEPPRLSADEAIDWYLRPRDAAPSPAFTCGGAMS